MGSAHTPFEGVGAALAIGLDSCDSPSALSVPRAHSSGRAALESPRELAQLRIAKDLAVAAAVHQTLAYRSERGLVAAVSKRLASHGQHSKILRDAQHLRAAAELYNIK